MPDYLVFLQYFKAASISLDFDMWLRFSAFNITHSTKRKKILGKDNYYYDQILV